MGPQKQKGYSDDKTGDPQERRDLEGGLPVPAEPFSIDDGAHQSALVTPWTFVALAVAETPICPTPMIPRTTVGSEDWT